MVENYDRLTELIDAADNSTGKAQEQFNKYADTVEYRLNTLSGSWETFRTKLLTSDTYKKGLDIANGLLEGINSLDKGQMAKIAVIGLTLGKLVISNFVTALKNGTGAITGAFQGVLQRTAQGAVSTMQNVVLKKAAIDQLQGQPNLVQGTPGNVSLIQAQQEYQNLIKIWQTNQEIIKLQEQENNLRSSGLGDENAEIQKIQQQIKLRQEENAEIAKGVANRTGITNPQQVLNAADTLGTSKRSAVASKIGSAFSSTGLGTQVLTNGLTSAVTAGLMSIFAGESLWDSVLNGLKMAAVSVVPQLIGAFLPGIIAALGPAGLIGAGIIGSVSILVKYIVDKNKEIERANQAATQAELNRLAKIKETNEDLMTDAQTASSSAQEAREEKKTVQNLIDTYNKLSKKTVLTSSEQTELDNTISKLNSDYADLVLAYDENTDKITFNTSAIEALNETLENQEKTGEAEAKMFAMQAALNQEEATQFQASQWNPDVENSLISILSNWSWGLDPYSEDMVGVNNASGSLVYNEALTGTQKKHQKKGDLTYITSENEWENSLSGHQGNYSAATSTLIASFNSLDAAVIDKWNQITGANLSTTEELTANDINNFIKENYVKDGRLDIDEVQKDLKTATEDNSKALQEALEKQINESTLAIYGSYADSEGEAFDSGFLKDIAYNSDLNDDAIEAAVEEVSEKEQEFKENISGDLSDFLTNFSQSTDEWSGEKGTLGNAAETLGIDQSEMNQILEMWGAFDDEGNLIENWSEFFGSAEGFVNNFSKMPEQLQQVFSNAGFSSEELNDLKNLDEKELNKRVSEIIATAFARGISTLDNLGVLAEFDEADLQKEEVAVEKYQDTVANVGTMTMDEYKAKIKDIADNNMSNKTMAAALKAANGIDSAITEYSDDAIKSYQEYMNTLKGYGLTSQQISGLSYDAQSSIINTVQSSNLTGENASGFAQELYKKYSAQNTTVQSTLSQIDVIGSSYTTLMAEADTYIKEIAKQGNMTTEEASKVYYDYIESAQKYVNSGIFNTAGVEAWADDMVTAADSVKDSLQYLYDAQEEALDNNGLITFDTFKDLYDNGFGEFVEVYSDGYHFLSDKAKQYSQQQTQIFQKTWQQEKKTNSYYQSVANQIAASAEDTKNFNAAIAYAKGNVANLDKEGNVAFQHLSATMQYLVKVAVQNGSKDIIAFQTLLAQTGAMLDTYGNFASGLGNTILSEWPVADDSSSSSGSGSSSDSSAEDTAEQLEDLNEQLEEAQEQLKEAQEDLEEAVHGTKDFESALDGLINYTDKIDRLADSLKDVKDNLEDVTSVDDAKKQLKTLSDNYDQLTVAYTAENKAIDDALANLKYTLEKNYSSYISFDEEGNPLVDFAYMTMDANDELKKGFEEEYNLYTEYLDKKQNNLDQLEEYEDERKEQSEEYLKNYVDIQEDVISILKEKAQDEIDTQKEKYEALEEADSDYLDALEEAIKKQRELRDQEDEWESLATKEKKLSLKQRDTSGTNAKEIKQLQNELEESRETQLDNAVDDIIEEMKDLYDKQKEARDAEIEYMEEVTENAQYFADWATQIMASWDSVEDMQAWYLANDEDAKDMTVEQTEYYLNELEDKYTDYALYLADQATDFTTDQEALNAAINEMYQNTSNNVANIGEVTQAAAQKAADELIKEAQKAVEEAEKSIQDIEDQIADLNNKVSSSGSSATKAVAATTSKMINDQAKGYETSYSNTINYINSILTALSSASVMQGTYGTTYNVVANAGKQGETILKSFTSAAEASDYMRTAKQNHKTTELTVVESSTGTNATNVISRYEKATAMSSATKLFSSSATNNHGVTLDNGTTYSFATKSAAEAALKKYQKMGYTGKAYASGGLVNYTGPAWVDGTRSKPEAFLNSEDTKRIGEAAKLLSNLPILNSTTKADTITSSNVGDTSIEIHINVESISSDYDVEQMADKIKQEIVDASNKTGNSVILKK